MGTRVVRRSLEEFFRDLVRSAMHTQAVITSEGAEHYLVRLLERFSYPDPGWQEKPLAVDYLESFHESGSARRGRLQDVGDRALFLSGVFMEHLESQLVSADYYMALGQNAYGHVARTGSKKRDVFAEMSQRFPDLVRVLTEISFEKLFKSDRQTLRVYTRWLHTRNQRDASWLVRRGISPVAPASGRTH